MRKSIKTIWLVVGIIFLIALSSEFGEMSKDIGLIGALISFALLVAIVVGITILIRKSRPKR